MGNNLGCVPAMLLVPINGQHMISKAPSETELTRRYWLNLLNVNLGHLEVFGLKCSIYWFNSS